MDFLKKMLDAKTGNDEGDEEELDGVFDHAIKDGNELATEMLRRARKYEPHGPKKDGSFLACLYLFIVTWIIVQRMWVGVEKMNAMKGPRNQVNRLWSLIRTAFSSADLPVQMSNMAKFEERWNGGYYDQWK